MRADAKAAKELAHVGIRRPDVCEIVPGLRRKQNRLARDAAVVPNATTPDHFAELRKHFSEDQIVELVGVISLFGWLNRWNDTFATELEDEPRSFAAQHLAKRGWKLDKHAKA